MSKTKITVQVATTDSPLPDGKTFAGISITVVDNNGATLPAKLVNGSETPPFSAQFDGDTGTKEASATLQALDSDGNALGNPVTVNESGTGGFPASFPSPTSASSISVSNV